MVYDASGKQAGKYEEAASVMSREWNQQCYTIEDFLQQKDKLEFEAVYFGYDGMTENTEQFLRNDALYQKIIYPFTMEEDAQKFQIMLDIAKIAVGARVRPCQKFNENDGYHMKQWVNL